MNYVRRINVEFNHCDPAGIVFYPRYFEMTNSVVENFFADIVGYPFSRMCLSENSGVPTVCIGATFSRPSRLGDRLEFTLRTKALGRSSVVFAIAARCEGEMRMQVDLTLVWVNATGRSAPWPPEIREVLSREVTSDAT